VNGSGAFAISLAIQAEAEIELLRQPFSGLMYVGVIWKISLNTITTTCCRLHQNEEP
jgi:hypothetical protein